MSKEDKIILVTVFACALLLSLCSCAVNHKASGSVEAKGATTVTINYKNCDRPEWSSNEVIDCIRAATEFEISIEDAEAIAEILKRSQPNETVQSPSLR